MAVLNSVVMGGGEENLSGKRVTDSSLLRMVRKTFSFITQIFSEKASSL